MRRTTRHWDFPISPRTQASHSTEPLRTHSLVSDKLHHLVLASRLIWISRHSVQIGHQFWSDRLQRPVTLVRSIRLDQTAQTIRHDNTRHSTRSERCRASRSLGDDRAPPVRLHLHPFTRPQRSTTARACLRARTIALRRFSLQAIIPARSSATRHGIPTLRCISHIPPSVRPWHSTCNPNHNTYSNSNHASNLSSSS